MNIGEHVVEGNPFQFINFDLEDEKDNSTLENGEIVEQLVEEFLDSTLAQQNLWVIDEDPLFNTSIVVSDHTCRYIRIFLFLVWVSIIMRVMVVLKTLCEVLIMEISTIFEHDIQNLESVSYINLSNHEDEKEWNSTNSWRKS